MASLDLDAARAARAEAAGQGHSFTFGGEDFATPPELPLRFGVALKEQDPNGAFDALLGAEAAARFWSHEPTTQDTEALMAWVVETYGLGSVGKSRA
jgi:hypothetical protein